MSEDVTPPAFAPVVGRSINNHGPSWSAQYPAESLARIRQADSVEAAAAQAATEVAILLHSIRRVLIWTAVVIPSVLVVLGIVLIVAGQDASGGSYY